YSGRLRILRLQVVGESQVHLRLHQVGAELQDLLEFADGRAQLACLDGLLAGFEMSGDGLIAGGLREEGNAQQENGRQAGHGRKTRETPPRTGIPGAAATLPHAAKTQTAGRIGSASDN